MLLKFEMVSQTNIAIGLSEGEDTKPRRRKHPSRNSQTKSAQMRFAEKRENLTLRRPWLREKGF